MKKEILILYICLLGLFLIPIISANNIWINYGQETIGIITLTEALGNPGISLEKTGEVMPSAPTPSSSGGSGGGEGFSVTNVYNIYNVTNVIKEKDKNEEEDKGEDNIETSSDRNLIGITGGVVGISEQLLPGSQIVFIVVVLCGTFIIFVIVKYKTRIRLKKNLK